MVSKKLSLPSSVSITRSQTTTVDYLPPPTTSQSQSGDALDLEHRMATLTRNEKRIRYDKEKHMETHMSELCQETPGSRIYRCLLEVLSVCRCDYFDSECTLKCRFNGA